MECYSDRIERISEHVVGTIVLVLALNSEFDYDNETIINRNVKIDEVIKLLAIHEIGEALIGDITPFDGITEEQKMEIEHKAMSDVIGNLSDRNVFLEKLFDFDEQRSNEAKFAHLCDKMEADLQAKVYEDCGMQRLLDDQENNSVFKSPKVIQMLNDGAQTAFDIWYGWDINMYEKNKDFPEFTDILKYAKNNNLLTLNNDVNKILKLKK